MNQCLRRASAHCPRAPSLRSAGAAGKLLDEMIGVIGPTRMPYDRMIQIVDITSKLVSNALSHKQ